MKDKLVFDGQFNLIIGSMWSGKTTELMRRYKRYTIGGKKCFMIKYKNDTRYGHEMVITHDKIEIPAFVCEYLYEVDNQIKNYDVICIDEVQFYKDAYIFIDKWANSGKIVEACGLNGTFNRKEFPIISKLIPIAENITFLKAVCRESGNDAVYSNINIEVDKNITEVIGGDEIYNATDRKTYYKDKQFYTFELIKEYVQIYANSKNIKLDDNILDEKLEIFIENNDDLELCEFGNQFISTFYVIN